MKTEDFFKLLEQHKDKSLLFEYQTNYHIGANYHITEVKHINVESVDCGAQTDSWRETVIQLWESPNEKDKTEYMTVYKAISIINKVGRIKPYVSDSELKFEYSNASFHTAQLFINDFEINNNNLIIKLAVKKTDCKAKELCGVPEMASESLSNSKKSCCGPNENCC